MIDLFDRSKDVGVMPETQKDEFRDQLRECISGDLGELCEAGKSIPVLLTAVEVELIKWALHEYETEAINHALNQVHEMAANRGIEKKEVMKTLEAGFEQDESKEILMKKLTLKLDEAVEIAAQKHRDQAELGLSNC